MPKDNFRMDQLPLNAVAGVNEVIATRISDVLEFDNDRKPTGKIIGQRVEVCSPAKSFSKFSVKLPNNPLPITTDEVSALNASGNFVKVTFTGFSATIWQDFRTGEVNITATANQINFLTLSKEGK